MLKRGGKRPAAAVLAAVLTACLLLCASAAKGDLLLFMTAEDCEAAADSLPELNAPHAVVLQRTGTGEQKKIRAALQKAGAADVTFMNLPGLKGENRTADRLAERWATAENTAVIASLLRQGEDDCIVYYAAEGTDRDFLSAFADKCAQGANDPACRIKNRQPDEYLYEVGKLLDGVTGGERTPLPADSSWRDAWEDGAQYDLSGLPETDGEGFLPEGEYVLEDDGQGLWVYLSRTLRVVITRHSTKDRSWFEADILRRPEGETLHVVSSLNGRANDPAKVAAENRLVVGINTDYYHYRINYKKKTGLIIRDGRTVRDSDGKGNGNSIPPLDTLLLDREGGFRLDRAGTLDAAKALELGAADVLAFGPILVKDSRIRMMTVAYHLNKEPRTAVGRLGENHYLAVVAEGRLRNAPGMTLDELGRLMAARRCTDAINLDGGHTSTLVFMGKRLNIIGNLAGNGTTGPRNMSELLGIGTYKGEDW